MTISRQSEPRWVRFAFLFYLIFLIFQPLNDPRTTLNTWLILMVIIGVFLGFYLWAYERRRKNRLWGIMVVGLLGLVYMPFNSGAVTFLIYAAASAGFLEPSQLARRVIAGLMGLGALAGIITVLVNPGEELLSWVVGLGIPLLLIGVIGTTNLISAERERYAQRLIEAQEENKHLATIAERERIARDLHDLLGHTLSVITLKAELAAKLAERDPAKAKAEMKEVERISREATSQVREAVQGYKSRGLQGELASAKLAFESAGIQFDYYAEAVNLEPIQESVLSIGLREAVTNVLRHSGATRCAVRLLSEETGVRLEVEDNGQGGEAKAGSGLTGMGQRVEALGGSLETNGASGFHLILHLPSSSPTALTALGRLKPQG